MHSTPFAVAGLSTSTNTHHTHGPTAWTGTTSGGPLGDALSQSLSRTPYQPGYLMSATQSTTSPQGAQRVEEAPLVKTKAKMNNSLLRGSASDFGMDSMFESSRRQRQAFSDEDAPPTNSVNDIPTEFHTDSSGTARLQQTNPLFSTPSRQRRHSRTNSGTTHPQTLYVVVFGYPSDKYSVTVEYFQSLGSSTDPDLNTEIANCFRIGYFDPADAMRAVRKSGDVLGGSWMVGVKWADPAQAESILGQLATRGAAFSTPFTDIGTTPSMTSPMDDSPSSHRIRPTGTPTPAIGTPLRLAPSALAFRKEKPPPPPTAVQKQPQPVPTSTSAATLGQSPGRSVFNQVSDLIFGW